MPTIKRLGHAWTWLRGQDKAGTVSSSTGQINPVRLSIDFSGTKATNLRWALSPSSHVSDQLSQAVVDAGTVPLLVLCIQEPEIALKRIAASTLSDISKHSPELAQTVVDAGAIAHLAQMILNPDAKLKRQVLSALSQIAKHSVDLAELVVEAEIFPVVLTCLKDSDEYVKKNGATLIREIAKHTPELSQLIVNAGGVAAVIDCIGSCRGTVRLPGIMMLGYVAAHSENLSMAVIVSKTKRALKNILQKCTYLPALEPLLHDAPPNIMKHIVGQFSKVLPHDSKARRLFVTTGGLKKRSDHEGSLSARRSAEDHDLLSVAESVVFTLVHQQAMERNNVCLCKASVVAGGEQVIGRSSAR
ncbi:sperm-associated antigen hypothetical protein [Limosa lapponica baueri]|uniref:Sperm-associated antigen 6 n=1 Tax=Limosa lapponica baueri TaxID=1758121 RepID=A0A2I0TKF1_LIMLA|nr:sperm-associated antigen hypothetical protein [Limosa lapponica baueri]